MMTVRAPNHCRRSYLWLSSLHPQWLYKADREEWCKGEEQKTEKEQTCKALEDAITLLSFSALSFSLTRFASYPASVE